MKHFFRFAYSVFFLMLFSPLAAEEYRFLVRTFAAMEPYSNVVSKNWSGGNAVKRWNTSYGVSPSVEGYYILGNVSSVGMGFQKQVQRRVLNSGPNAEFSCIPVYFAGRFVILNFDGFDMYTTFKLGYSFFLDSSGFRDLWSQDGAALEDVKNGIYASANLGVLANLVRRTAWALDISVNTGYSYFGAMGIAANEKNYPVSYQALSVEFALEWLF